MRRDRGEAPIDTGTLEAVSGVTEWVDSLCESVQWDFGTKPHPHQYTIDDMPLGIFCTVQALCEERQRAKVGVN